MAKKFDIDAITDPIIRQLMRQGEELKVVLKAAKGKTQQDIDQIRNWDRAQRGTRQTQYRYNPDGSRVPHSDPGRRPHLPRRVIDDVWKRDRDAQERAWPNMNPNDRPPQPPGPNDMWVRDRQDNWVNVQYRQDGRRPWDMGHIPEHEFRTLHQQYMDDLANPDIDDADALDDFLSEFRDPDNYVVEDRIRNQSHDFEAPR